MTFLYDLPTFAVTMLLCSVFLILWLTMMLLAESVYQRMYRGFSVFFFLIVIVNYLFFQMCLNEKYRIMLWGVIAYIFVMILFDIFIIRKGMKYRQENFTVISVKQGLDAMEEGICFYTENGLPQFTNKYMNDVSLALSGRTIVDASKFWKNLLEKKINPDCEVITSIGDMVIVKTPDKVCAISNRDIGGELKEMVMVDITDEYGTFEDPRDGHVYKTTVYNGQTWLAQDIDYYDSSDTLFVNQSLCAKVVYKSEQDPRYNRKQNPSENEYCDGASRFYTVNVSKKACPDGWRLPTKEDLKEFTEKDGAEWRAFAKKIFVNLVSEDPDSDVFGLSLRLDGYVDPYGSRQTLSQYNIFWLEEGIYVRNGSYKSDVSGVAVDTRENGAFVAVRCIKK